MSTGFARISQAPILLGERPKRQGKETARRVKNALVQTRDICEIILAPPELLMRAETVSDARTRQEEFDDRQEEVHSLW